MAHVFHGRRLPEPAAPAGYSWLVDHYDLAVPLPPRLAGIATVHHRVETLDWLLLTPRHAPDESLAGHITFALKWEGVNLSVLAALAQAVSADLFADTIRTAPTGRYMRRFWFLVEWLTGEELDLPDVSRRRGIVPALDPARQFALADGEVSARHQVRNTLPGTPDFCPLVRRTPELDRLIARKLDDVALGVVGRTHPDVLARASAFLQLSDSRASFAIENERPGPERTRRWARAIARAGGEELTVESFEALQRIVIEDDRFVPLGLRTEGGFVGEHDRDTRGPIPEHICARPDDLPSLMRGIGAFEERVLRFGYETIVAAASLAFGFVYVHPFVDGNGRLHRWLIHHVMAAAGFASANVAFPVSAAMLRDIKSYREVLRSHSRPLLPLIDWRPAQGGNVEVLNETAAHYRYFDATAHAEFLYRCVEETVSRDLPAEVAYLEAYDRFSAGVRHVVDMPQRTLDLLHRFLLQNGGQLSRRARDNEFQALRPEEVEALERLFAETTGALPAEPAMSRDA